MSITRITLLAAILSGCSDYGMTHSTVKYVGDTGSPDEPAEQDAPAEPDVAAEPDEAQDPGEGAAVPEEEDCEDEGVVFDVDSVSTLQDAFGLPMVRDGLTLEGPDASEGWRPTTVEVMVMLPAWYFDWYADENSVSIEIYPSSSPQGRPWRLEQRVRKADLSWSDLRLPADADWSGDDRDQIAAWMSFDFSDQIAPGELTSPDLFVAVGWDSMGYPNVGYSNFELSCTANWTDYGDGSWRQNSGSDCSWPMMRISYERIVAEDCD
jgi:hypothetical protein